MAQKCLKWQYVPVIQIFSHNGCTPRNKTQTSTWAWWRGELNIYIPDQMSLYNVKVCRELWSLITDFSLTQFPNTVHAFAWRSATEKRLCNKGASHSHWSKGLNLISLQPSLLIQPILPVNADRREKEPKKIDVCPQNRVPVVWVFYSFLWLLLQWEALSRGWA